MIMNILEAKQALDKVIAKARVHLYKPIQIAEILYRDRVEGDIDLLDKETYRTFSRKWRDDICVNLLGRTSTSSVKYQDDLFSNTAVPPDALKVLGDENKKYNGIVEAYIYQCFERRFLQMSTGLNYCRNHDKSDFCLGEFIDLFWNEPGLRRSIDKIYEIVVYSLFYAIVDCLNVKIIVESDVNKKYLLDEFSDFAEKVIGLRNDNNKIEHKANIYRVGVTNAADRGLDIWANYGMAIQIKHLSLTEELAEDIVSSVSSDRIVIVCKDSDEKIIVSLLNQIGWKSKIQSVVTENDLISWYDRALRGIYSSEIGDKILTILQNEIKIEFPAVNDNDMLCFKNSRGYDNIVLKGIWLSEL